MLPAPLYLLRLIRNQKVRQRAGYALAKIEYDQSAGIHYHESRGTFFGEDGVKKYFATERGHEWTGGDVFDDFC